MLTENQKNVLKTIAEREQNSVIAELLLVRIYDNTDSARAFLYGICHAIWLANSYNELEEVRNHAKLTQEYLVSLAAERPVVLSNLQELIKELDRQVMPYKYSIHSNRVDLMVICCGVVKPILMQAREKLSNSHSDLAKNTLLTHSYCLGEKRGLSLIDEAIAALSSYGLTRAQINDYSRSSKTQFNTHVKNALIYLVTGHDPNPLYGLPELPLLAPSQQLSVADALNELRDLNEDQIETLVKEYFYGLRGAHLRTFIPATNDSFSKFHKWSISALMHKASLNLSAIQAIERVNGKTADEANDLWHQTINSTWYQMTK